METAINLKNVETMIPRNQVTVQMGSLMHSEPLPPPSKEGDPLHVWLVDDNREARDLTGLLLSAVAGFDCSTQFDSSASILKALANERPPDVILLDVQLDGECGLDAVRPIREQAPATRVLMLTACFDNHRKQRALADGASDFLLKSYPMEEIARRIQWAMEQPPPDAAACETSPGAAESGNNGMASLPQPSLRPSDHAAGLARRRAAVHRPTPSRNDYRRFQHWRRTAGRLLRRWSVLELTPRRRKKSISA